MLGTAEEVQPRVLVEIVLGRFGRDQPRVLASVGEVLQGARLRVPSGEKEKETETEKEQTDRCLEAH